MGWDRNGGMGPVTMVGASVSCRMSRWLGLPWAAGCGVVVNEAPRSTVCQHLPTTLHHPLASPPIVTLYHHITTHHHHTKRDPPPAFSSSSRSLHHPLLRAYIIHSLGLLHHPLLRAGRILDTLHCCILDHTRTVSFPHQDFSALTTSSSLSLASDCSASSQPHHS